METVIQGKFSTGKHERTKLAKGGNFTGTTASGKTIFVKKELMSAIGINKDADFKSAKLVHCLVKTENNLYPRDAQGNIDYTATPESRLSAIIVSLSQDEIVALSATAVTSAIAVAKKIEEEIDDADLSDFSRQNILMNANFFS